MTDVAAPGWYPDSEGKRRWWDGTQWTDSVRAPYTGASAPLKAPDGTLPNTPQIWIIVALFAFQMIYSVYWLASFDWSGYLRASMNPGNLQVFQVFGIAYVLLLLISLGVYGGSAALAYSDWKTLAARGVPRPFHFAFTFITPIVYVIGRSVIARRRTGTGIAPMWVVIILYVLYFIAAMVATFAGMATMMNGITDLYPLGGY